jgi:hypothetical protein
MDRRTFLQAAGATGLCLTAGARSAPAEGQGAARATSAPVAGAPVDVAAWGMPLPDGCGVIWEDPREIHRVVVRFRGQAPASEGLALEYWGSRWPEQRLPKHSEPGGGNAGWWELGNWYNGGFRRADAEASAGSGSVAFAFRPVNRQEHPGIGDFAATFRFTLKIRIVGIPDGAAVEAIEAYSDSTWARRTARIAWRASSRSPVHVTAFNGWVDRVSAGARSTDVEIWATDNGDPNTFDRTLVSVTRGRSGFTFRMDDLAAGPLLIPRYAAAVLPENDDRSYAAVDEAREAAKGRTLYDRVAEMDEQSWQAAWAGMAPKRSDIIFPMGLDGGRERFMLHPDGSIAYRINNEYILRRPGADTERLKADGEMLTWSFGLPPRPTHRELEEGSLPICTATFGAGAALFRQTAFVTCADGLGEGAAPDGDAFAVCMARLEIENMQSEPVELGLRVACRAGSEQEALKWDADGSLRSGTKFRAILTGAPAPRAAEDGLDLTWRLAPGERGTAVLTLPFIAPRTAEEEERLRRLRFDVEHAAVAAYWRRRMDAGMRLTTPEPVLTDFHHAHLSHLLINCEKEPGADRRFARVGSFQYAAYGNESCMMVVDLDRRGRHKEARECLEAWFHYQGTVGLPGDFSTRAGVLYGAGGYEHGGYNQHHGWILWCLVEHYRFTRDRDWLAHAVPGILAGAQWIVGERRRTVDRTDAARGLLPAGSLEDIGDWWPWLSTNCYTWRGLDAAAWALEQAGHPAAARIRREATAFHRALLAAFRGASQRAPVVRLRDGTAIPKIPSMPYRRGRAFGWICETLEGALHLLITRALDSRSPEALDIIKDYEDNLYLSNQYGYVLDDFERHWFGRGGMSMQACLLLDAEPYLYRDDVKHALRAIFNAIAVGFFPDVRMLTEHALPEMGDWRGDHFKTSDEANAAGWLRYLFVREEGEELLVGQAVPRVWLHDGSTCGVRDAATHFGPMSVEYHGERGRVTADLIGPSRNPPSRIRLRFRMPSGSSPQSVTVDGRPWRDIDGDWVNLPGSIGRALIVVSG